MLELGKNLAVEAPFGGRHTPVKTPKGPKAAWCCLECGKKMNVAAARRAVNVGCPECGGTDIDLNV